MSATQKICAFCYGIVYLACIITCLAVVFQDWSFESKVTNQQQELEKYSFVDGKNSFDGKDILGDFSIEGIVMDP